jgi:hypothetical protein
MGPIDGDRWRIEVPRRDPAEVDNFTYMVWAASDGRSLREVSDFLNDEFRNTRETTIMVIPLSVYRLLDQGAAFLDRTP